MKKAFDQNVSRAKPRLRLGIQAVEVSPEPEMAPPPLPLPESLVEQESAVPLETEVKARIERARQPRPAAADALQQALVQAQSPDVNTVWAEPSVPVQPATEYPVETKAVASPGGYSVAEVVAPPMASAAPVVAQQSVPTFAPGANGSVSFVASATPSTHSYAAERTAAAQVQPQAYAAPSAPTQVQPQAYTAAPTVPAQAQPQGYATVGNLPQQVQPRSAPAQVTSNGHIASTQVPMPQAQAQNYAVTASRSEDEVFDEQLEVQPSSPDLDPATRRERLKERLRAVRENPRPQPLPPSVAQAGVMAVERIATLQTELYKVKGVNLSLTQELEASRRQSEKATEEARARMDEARRLSEEAEARTALLSELEKELSVLESERDESLLALQDTRQALVLQEQDKENLKVEISKRDQALADSLTEEERLATELEAAHAETDALRKSLEALTSERDVLARQVSDLMHERTELLEARRALESVHKALSQAVARPR